MITPKLDRMFRSAHDALNVLVDLKDAGISLHMIDLGGDVTGNGISKLVFTILSAVAEAGSVIASEIGSARRKRIGRRGGATRAARSRMAYQLATEGAESVLVPVPEQQAVIARVKVLRAEGKPLRAIQEAIRDEGAALSLDAISRISRPGQEGAP